MLPAPYPTDGWNPNDVVLSQPPYNSCTDFQYSLGWNSGVDGPPSSANHAACGIVSTRQPGQVLQIISPYPQPDTLIPANHGYLGLSTSAVGTLVADHWNHIIVSADMSKTASVTTNADGSCTVDQTNFLWIAVNNLDCSPTSISDVDATNVLDATFPPGSILPKYGQFSGGTWNQGKISWGPNFTQNATPTSPATYNVGPVTYGPADFVFSGWDVGVPCPAANIDNGWDFGAVELAYVQCFTGVSLDTSNPSNIARFATPVSGGIVPTNQFPASVPGGTCIWAFKRDKLKNINFQNNMGNDGTFSVVGSMIDYTPGPGQAGTPGLMLQDLPARWDLPGRDISRAVR